MSEPVGWPQNAYVGQKVVCIEGPSFRPGLGLDHDFGGHCFGPVINNTYEIRSIVVWKHLIGFRLVGITVRDWKPGEEKAWRAARFRPAQSTETGMRILTALLVPDKQKELVS